MANEVKITLSADGSGLKVAVDGAQAQFVKLGDEAKKSGDKASAGVDAIASRLDSLKSTVTNVAQMMAGAFAVEKIYSYAKEMALLAARYETLGVAMQVVGQHAGYSAAQMEAAAVGMQRTGISMVESRQQAMRLVQAHIDLADSQKLARIAQDAAVIGNINSSEAFAAMIHGISTAQPEVLRTIGLNVSMEQSYKVMAGTLHKHVDALTQNEKTQAILNAVMLAGADIAGTYEAAMDTAGKQLNSMKRYTDDLKTVQGEVFNEVLTTAVMAYTAHLKDANQEMKAMAASGELKAWGMELAGIFVSVANAIDNTMTGVKMLGTWLAQRNVAGDITEKYQVKLDAIPQGFGPQAMERSKLIDQRDAEIKASLALLDESQVELAGRVDRFDNNWEKRQKTMADKAAKALAATAATEAERTRVMAVYADERDKGLLSMANYVKVMNAFTQASYGDNHVYRDTPSGAPKASTDVNATLISKVKDGLAASRAELEMGEKLTPVQKEIATLYETIANSKEKYTLKTLLTVDALMQEKLSNEELNLERIKTEKADLAAAESHIKYLDSLDKGLDKLKAESLAQQEHNERLGLGKEAIAALDAAKLESQAATLDLLAIKTLDKNLDEYQYKLYKSQAEELRKLAALKGRGAATEAALDAAKKAEEAWASANKSIGDGLYSAISEGGDSAIKKLIKDMKEWFARLVLSPIISPIAAFGASLLNPTAASASQGGTGTNALTSLSMVQTLKGVYDTVASGFTNITSSVSAGFNSLAYTQAGQSLGLSTGQALAPVYDATASGSTLVSAGSGGLTSAGSAIKSGLGAAGTALAGVAVGSMIAGNKVVLGMDGTTTSVIGAAIGYALTPVLGPLGPLIGGAIGGLTNAMFGSGPTELRGQGTRGTFSGSGFSGNNYANYHKDGGWFSSDSNWTTTSAIDQATVKAWGDAFTGVKASVASVATSLGLSTESITSYSKYIDIAAGSSKESIQAMFTGMADDMSAAFLGTYETTVTKATGFLAGFLPDVVTTVFKPGAFMKDGETASVTLARLSTSLTTANAWMAILGNTLFSVSLAGGDAASKLADAFGGMDKLTAASKTYYETYYTQTERNAQSLQDMAKALALVGLTLPNTKDAFRALVTTASQHLDTDALRTTYALLLTIAPEFAATTDSIKSAWQSVTDTIFSEVSRIRGLLATDSPDSYAQAQTRFAIATAQARSGDDSAAKLLPALSQSLLTLAVTNAASMADLQRIRGQTAGSLEATGSMLTTGYGLTLPSYDVGTNYVPRDMIAQIHEGEAIIPRAFNPQTFVGNGGAGGGSDAVVTELRALRQDNVNMRAELRAIAEHASKTSRILSRVTRDGESMQTVAG